VPALGRGRLTHTHDVTFDGMLPRTDGLGSGVASAAARDFWWGFNPPTPTQIPYDWLSPPARFRADQPINDTAVTRSGAETAYLSNQPSIDLYGDFATQETIDTISPDDPASLATWLIAYYAGHRMRCPAVTLNLLSRTTADIWTILGVRIGTRIQITGAPATWPEGTSSLIVEGIAHSISQNGRTVTWTTSPVIGATPGAVGPWFKLNGGSSVNGTDVVPF
jgi:hypothetical protein